MATERIRGQDFLSRCYPRFLPVAPYCSSATRQHRNLSAESQNDRVLSVPDANFKVGAGYELKTKPLLHMPSI